MFDPKALNEILKVHRPTLLALSKIERELNDRFYFMEEAVLGVILSVATGEPLLLVGPPGTAKSRLIRAFCGLVGVYNEDDPTKIPPKETPFYFEYLLTPFTEPSELFGFYEIDTSKGGTKLVRKEDRMMHQATVVYIDEVFNASSAILNSMLTFLNEGYFHDRGDIKQARREAVFAATNHVPQAGELKAVFDRFLLRCWVENAKSQTDILNKLFNKGWAETYYSHDLAKDGTNEYKDLLNSLKSFREAIKAATSQGRLKPIENNVFLSGLTTRVEYVRKNQYSEMSNRRMIKMIHAMLVHSLYRAAKSGGTPEMGVPEMDLIEKYFLDVPASETDGKLKGWPNG